VAFRPSTVTVARHSLLAMLIVCATLAACARESESPLPPAGLPVGAPLLSAGQTQYRAGATKYRVVFSFGENAYGYDGAGPEAGLINVNGTLYGTTSGGGTNKCSGVDCGTVFSVSTTGTENVLHDFSGTPDGNTPFAGLVTMNGALYGTTAEGGSYGGGTVFSTSASGTETVVHSFGSGSDGVQPMAGLTAVHGNLYGTTLYGGEASCSPSTDGCGTVFRIDPSGKEHVLHTFSSGSDGAYPAAVLLDLKGTLYGTTEGAGPNGGGTVFSITTAGKETVLFSFDGPDGSGPEAGIIAAKGTLYGTTEGGGSGDWGTVFSISKTGTNERVLHSFSNNGSDGIRPEAPLIAVKGMLYGTTSGGGAASFGTIFSIDEKNGAETVLHSFGEGYASDGVYPQAGLIDVNGTLYGTTSIGGVTLPSCPYSGICDWGTVFALKL
jgi:uncharacterized repeat protein (TIGR03803 family)